MNKLTLIKDLKQPDWLEATWVEEVITTSLVQNEVDGEIVEETVDNTETTILHCESYSGHKEHIQMLENKCMEFDTTLNEEQKSIIKEVSKAFVVPSQEEIEAEAIQHLVNEAKNYLANTDYKVTVDYFATLTKEEQDELISKRAIAREFIRSNK